MTFVRCNPIKPHRENVTRDTASSNLPMIFVPKMYVRQRKWSLYINLYVLLGGLWALTVSHNIDIFETDARAMLKNTLSTSGLFVSHLVAVPFIIRNLRLHYSIILGAMGMSATSFLHYFRNPVVLSVAICLRVIFVALFDISAMIYAVKLARLCSRIQGNAVFHEILAVRNFTTVFGCTANIFTLAWNLHIQKSKADGKTEACNLNFCPRSYVKEARLVSYLSIGENTMFTAITVVIALSGVILIAMYLKPIKNYGHSDISDEPKLSNTYNILKQFSKPRAKKLAILIIHCVVVQTLTNDFVATYAGCSFAREYNFLITCMKELSIMFSAFSCMTLVDVMGFYWLYGIVVFTQFSSFLYLAFTDLNLSKPQLLYMMIYYFLFVSISLEVSIVHILVIDTLGDEEVAAWCFYSILGDIVNILRTIANIYLCINIKLWVLIGASPIAIIAIAIYCCKSCENSSKNGLHGTRSMLIKTPKKMFSKSDSFDLKIIVDEYDSIRKVETFHERRYTLRSKFLVPPPDDFSFETSFSINEL